MPTDRERLLWTAALFGFAAVNGAAMQVRGALLVSFRETFGVSESLLGLVTPVGAVGYVVVALTFGLAAGRVDARRWLLIGLGGTLLSFLLLGVAPLYLLVLATIGLRSATTGVISALDRPLLSHLYPSGRGRVYTLHTMVWAVGATLGPLLVTAALLAGSWRLTYLVLAVCLAPVLVAVRRLEVPDRLANEQSFAAADLPKLLRRPAVAAMATSLVLVGGVESVFFTWLPYYAGQFFAEGTANVVLSVYLAAYVPGRFAFSRLAGRIRYVTLVVASAAVALAALAVTLTYPGGIVTIAGVFVIGALVSGFFPTLLSWGTDALPEFSGPVNAVAITAAQVGFFVFPAVVGVLAERTSIERAMGVQAVLLVALILVAVVARWRVPADGVAG